MKTFHTDQQIEGLLFPALALLSILYELAEGGSAKAKKSLCALVGIGDELVEKLKISTKK